MGDSPEVAADPPAIKALRNRRRVLERSIRESERDLARITGNMSYRKGLLDNERAERDDIDRAIQALSYPNE